MSSNPERQQQQQIQRRRLDDDDHDQDEGAAGQQQQLRRPSSEQQHRHEGLLMPMESSPYLRYTDLEDYKLKAFGYGAYGTAFHEIEDQEDPLQLKASPQPTITAFPDTSNQEDAATGRLDRKLK